MQHIIQHKNFLPNNILYGFFGKHPDITTHRYRDYDNAEKNRNIILKSLGVHHSSMSLLKQVHGVDCVKIESSDKIDYDNEADAQITKNHNVILAMHTADCTPVLLVDENAGIVATAHAGWRGALDGIIDSTLRKMCEAGANINDIVAIIGPCIRQNSYEVSEDFINQFLLEDIGNAKFFINNKKTKGKYFFNLPGYVKQTLAQGYIRKVYDVGIDTRIDPDFFSYRQACLARKKLEGYNLSFIALKP